MNGDKLKLPRGRRRLSASPDNAEQHDNEGEGEEGRGRGHPSIILLSGNIRSRLRHLEALSWFKWCFKNLLRGENHACSLTTKYKAQNSPGFIFVQIQTHPLYQL